MKTVAPFEIGLVVADVDRVLPFYRDVLAASRLDEMAVWGFGDFLLQQDYDVVSSTTRLRQAGFHDTVDTEAMFLGHLARYRAARLLP